MASLLIHNATIVNRGRAFSGAVFVENGIIADVIREGELPTADHAVDAGGGLLMPGVIDTHVHFREPGLTEKADIASESRAAVVGGVTSVIDMPNTIPPTVSLEAWKEKMNRAAFSSMVNYAFFLGVTCRNISELLEADYTRVPGVKLFLGSTTGDMMMDDEIIIARLLDEMVAPIVVHAESEELIRKNLSHLNPTSLEDLPVQLHSQIRSSEACLQSSEKIVRMARKHGALLHLAHVSSADELKLLQAAPALSKRITAETCPQYLLFTDADYTRLGARIKCNPAIKCKMDSEALREAVLKGVIDTIATDHAPHLLSEKRGGALQARSGMPMIQFSLIKMLDLFPPTVVADKMSHNPARIFGIEGRGFIERGMQADLTVVNVLDEPHTITDSEVISRCGWTPLAGLDTYHRVMLTMVNGHIAYCNGEISELSSAQPLSFSPMRR